MEHSKNASLDRIEGKLDLVIKTSRDRIKTLEKFNKTIPKEYVKKDTCKMVTKNLKIGISFLYVIFLSIFAFLLSAKG